jgi:hypothetical protein
LPYAFWSVLNEPAVIEPRFLSIHIFPVRGLVTLTIAVAPAAQLTAIGAYTGADETGTVKVQLWPPTTMEKLAVPLVVGVPVIV